MKELSGKLTGEGIKAAVVVSRFNDFLTKELLAGALDCLQRHGVRENDITVAWVPGANELPLVADKLAQTGAYDGVIALGAVVQGATPHADLINAQVSRSLAKTAMDTALPLINGVVCANTLEQAIERCGTKAGNKGWSAAQGLIEMVNLYKQIGKKG
jgi:6,7-dimethyl-8-ribityllumazine synthase